MAAFIQFLRSEATDELLRHPNCFALLALIAQRARRDVPGFNPHGLAVGEALVGDPAAVGLSRQAYRTAITNLQKWSLITTRTTNKGTIAKLANSMVYDINAEAANHQPNPKKTTSQPKNNPATTTNNNLRTKEETTEQPSLSDSAPAEPDGLDFDSFWQAYDRKEGSKRKMGKQWAALPAGTRRHVLTHLSAYRAFKTKSGPGFMPHPQTFLNGHLWEAESFAQPPADAAPAPPMPRFPSDVPDNWPAGTPYVPQGSRIPNMSDILRTDWTPPAATPLNPIR